MPPKTQSGREPSKGRKSKKEAPVEDEDLNTRVTAELSAAFLGTMKVRRASTTPVWDDFMVNRPVDPKAVRALIENMRLNNNLRIQPAHHVKGTIDDEIMQEMFRHHGLNRQTLREKTARAEYVELDHDWLVSKEYLVRLEAGQHRYAAQDSLTGHEEDDWWPMDLYVLPLSPDALQVLRNNDKQQHSDLNDGMRLLNLFRAEDEIARAKREDNQVLAQSYFPVNIVANFRLTNSRKTETTKLSERGRQLWGRQDLRSSVRQYISVPGLRDELTFGTFDNFVKFRMNDVKSHM